MISKIICYFKGHTRGKLVRSVALDKQNGRNRIARVYACKRCKQEHTRIIKEKA